MKKILIAASIAMLMSSAAFAKGHGDHGQGNEGHGKHGGHADDDGHGKHARYSSHARYAGHNRYYVADHHRGRNGRAVAAQRWKAEGRHDNGRHLGQYKHWSRGERLPVTYLGPNYYLRDYDRYHLSAPPSGYVWVRPYPDASQYYLVQAATGLIQQIFGL